MDLNLYRSSDDGSVEASDGRPRGVLVNHGDEGVSFPGLADVSDFTVSGIYISCDITKVRIFTGISPRILTNPIRTNSI